MKFKHKVIHKLAAFVRAINIPKLFSIKKNDIRQSPPFTLVFFCGAKGLNYLNASLVSVYKHWKKIPEIFIITDGTPEKDIKKELIHWPKKISVISWLECADSFRLEGNDDLYAFACNELFGKKFVGVMYCAKRFCTLYSDSDILWFNSPEVIGIDCNKKPAILMGKDFDHFYAKEFLASIDESSILNNAPLNSGLIYANGDFSTFPKWKQFCFFLANNKDLGFSEQTAFAILSNYFNPGNFFKPNEILIKLHDDFSLKYTRKEHPDAIARHYVSTKWTTFWRDITYMFLRK